MFMSCLCFSDFTVKFVDVESKEQKLFSGHEAPVLSVALHPDEQLIVSRISKHVIAKVYVGLLGRRRT